MPTKDQSSIPKTALLGAVNLGSDNGPGAIALVGGQPLLAHQMSALHGLGISRFLIEVDSVPGELLALVDHHRDMGSEVEFVRSAADVQNFLGMKEQLVVQAEALYLSPHLIRGLLGEKGPYVLTVDGRDENAAFERMDLNTRWAGWAILGAPTISALGELPDGWSIASSLLRQAMQDRVKIMPLPQQDVQDGQVRPMNSLADAELLSRQILTVRARRFDGFIESRIFAPVAAWLAPWIWQSRSGSKLVDGATAAAAAGSLGLAVTGWTTSFAALAVFSIFLLSLRSTVDDEEGRHGLGRWLQPTVWLLLAIASIAAGYDDFSYSSDGAYAATTMVGLLLLAQQLNLPFWGQKILKSPALVAVVALCSTPLLGFAQAAQWMSLAQLAALVIAKWSTGLTPKKPKQA